MPRDRPARNRLKSPFTWPLILALRAGNNDLVHEHRRVAVLRCNGSTRSGRCHPLSSGRKAVANLAKKQIDRRSRSDLKHNRFVRAVATETGDQIVGQRRIHRESWYVKMLPLNSNAL